MQSPVHTTVSSVVYDPHSLRGCSFHCDCHCESSYFTQQTLTHTHAYKTNKCFLPSVCGIGSIQISLLEVQKFNELCSVWYLEDFLSLTFIQANAIILHFDCFISTPQLKFNPVSSTEHLSQHWAPIFRNTTTKNYTIEIQDLLVNGKYWEVIN